MPLLAATVGALLVTAPATAADVPDLPTVVVADLDRGERAELAEAAPSQGDAVEEVSVVTDDGDGIRIDTVAVKAATAPEVARVLGAQPSVETAGVAQPVRALGDPLRPQQWPLDVLRADDVRPLTTGRPVVAVVDTGVDGTHPDLDHVLVPGTDLVAGGSVATDPNGHGSHVAGIVGAEVGNGVGVEGLLSGVAVMPVRVLGADGSGSTATVAKGVVWAVDHGADVVNLSLGGDASDPTLRAAVEYAEDRDVVVVAATGNDATRGNPVTYPAAYPSVLAVAATDSASRRASFSGYGPHVDVAAPGVGVLSTVPGGGYAAFSGTSMAAPYAAAVVAAVASRYPGLDPARVRARVTASARDLGTPGFDESYGHGLVDPVAALTTPPAGTGPDVVTAPGAPTLTAVVPGDRRLTLRWAPPADTGGSAVTGYRVSLASGGTSRVVTLGRVASTVVTSLVNGVTYRVGVQAVGTGGVGPTGATVEATPRTLASAPRATGVAPGNAAATLTWQPPASDGRSRVTGYRVTATRSGSPTRVTETGPDARAATVTGLSNGYRWTVRVRARTAAGTGTASGSLAVVPRTAPGAPWRAAVSAGSTRDRAVSVRVAWKAPSTTGGAPLSGYTVRLRRTGSSQVVVRAVGAATRAVSVPGLRRGARYTATVQARNAAGPGRPSTWSAAVPAR